MKRPATIIAALIVLLLSASGHGLADNASDANRIVDQAETTLKNFLNDPDMKWFASHLKKAKGIFILPRLTKNALIAVEGGNGVVLARDEQTGAWSGPVFYQTAAASFGLEGGVEIAETIILIMTRMALDSLLTGEVTLGVDGSVTVGPKGMGAEPILMTDFVTFTRARERYAKVAFDGAWIGTRDELNAAYYGEAVRPSDILIAHKAKPNPNSKELHAMLSAAEKQVAAEKP